MSITKISSKISPPTHLEKLIIYANMWARVLIPFLLIQQVWPGCSITVVRMHGVHVARVQFPAPRHQISKR